VLKTLLNVQEVLKTLLNVQEVLKTLLNVHEVLRTLLNVHEVLRTLLNVQGPLDVQHSLNEVHLDVGGVEALDPVRVCAGGGAGAREPRPLLRALDTSVYTLTGPWQALLSAGAAALVPVLPDELVLNGLRRVDEAHTLSLQQTLPCSGGEWV